MAFNHSTLEWKLQERLTEALNFINRTSQGDVLKCSSDDLAEIINHFSISAHSLRMDSMRADERIIESVDMTFERKTGHTNHSFFITIENDCEWMEGIDSQRTEFDDYPLAFLDKERSRVSIRLMLSPLDKERALGERLRQHSELVKRYVDFPR